MLIKRNPWLLLIFILVFTALACNFPTAKRASGPEATLTAFASQFPVFLTQTSIAQTLSPGVTATPTITNTPQPGVPTSTTQPSATQRPPVQTPCDWATFISDVSVPDGTTFAPNQTFTKTWRLKNTGTCTWSTSYALVFDSGTAMNAPSAIAMPGSVAPGQSIDLSVNLTAPSTAGTYRGNFKLRNAYGATFGIGNNANTAFWVEIKVANNTPTFTPTPTVTSGPSTTTVYDFVTNYCSAEWVSGAGVLGCPGSDTDVQGFVVKLNNPTLETGQAAGEAAIETHPQWVDDGVITGKFPAITVNNNYFFRARIGCLQGASGCNVKYQLNYRANGGSLQNLGEWFQTNDNSVQELNVNLGSLAGSSVEFILAVTSNGTSGQDWALWVAPKIVRVTQ